MSVYIFRACCAIRHICRRCETKGGQWPFTLGDADADELSDNEDADGDFEPPHGDDREPADRVLIQNGVSPEEMRGLLQDQVTPVEETEAYRRQQDALGALDVLRQLQRQLLPIGAVAPAPVQNDEHQPAQNEGKFAGVVSQFCTELPGNPGGGDVGYGSIALH